MSNELREINSLLLQLKAKQEQFEYIMHHEGTFEEAKKVYKEIKELKQRLAAYSTSNNFLKSSAEQR